MTAMPKFRTGLDEIDNIATGGAQHARDHFLSIDDGDSVIVRFIDDPIVDGSWIAVDQWGNIPTKPKPADWKNDNWPTGMSAISRSDVAFEGMFDGDVLADYVAERGLKDSYGKPLRPMPRVWALAVLREEVFGDGSDAMMGEAKKGKFLGFRDIQREVKYEVGGKEVIEVEPAIIVVNQAKSNFFSTLISLARVYNERDSSLLERDVLIKRTGTGTDTKYTITALDPTPGHDLRDPATAAPYKEGRPSIAEIVMARVDDEYYNRFWLDGPTESDNGSTAAAPAKDLEEDKLAAMRDRITGYQSSEEASSAPAPAAPAAEESAAPAAPSGPMNFG